MELIVLRRVFQLLKYICLEIIIIFFLIYDRIKPKYNVFIEIVLYEILD